MTVAAVTEGREVAETAILGLCQTGPLLHVGHELAEEGSPERGALGESGNLFVSQRR
jgi:hypothetical protein